MQDLYYCETCDGTFEEDDMFVTTTLDSTARGDLSAVPATCWDCHTSE
jgi:hypothetical protein